MRICRDLDSHSMVKTMVKIKKNIVVSFCNAYFFVMRICTLLSLTLTCMGW